MGQAGQAGQAERLCKRITFCRSSLAGLSAALLVRRWERAEEVRERAEEEARGGSGAAEAGAQAQAMPADAALSIEEKLASKRQIFAPREAFKCAAAAPASMHLLHTQPGPSRCDTLSHAHAAVFDACLCHSRRLVFPGRVCDASVHLQIGGCGGQNLMCASKCLCQRASCAQDAVAGAE